MPINICQWLFIVFVTVSESVRLHCRSPPLQVPKRTVSLRSFSKLYERQAAPERQPTLIVKPTISPPIPLSPPVVHSETTDIATINHARSKSDELSSQTKSKFIKDDEPVTSFSPPEKPTITNAVEEQKMEGSLLPGGKIETLQPINAAMTVISMEEEEFESDNEKVMINPDRINFSLLLSLQQHISARISFDNYIF